MKPELANRRERITRRAWLSRDYSTWRTLTALAGEAHCIVEVG